VDRVALALALRHPGARLYDDQFVRQERARAKLTISSSSGASARADLRPVRSTVERLERWRSQAELGYDVPVVTAHQHHPDSNSLPGHGSGQQRHGFG
jgi:hypothetical protein